MNRMNKRRIHNIRRFIILAVLAVMTVTLIVLIGKFLFLGIRKITGNHTEVEDSVSVSMEESVPSPEPTPETVEPYEDEVLKSVVNAVIDTYDGTWSVYYAQPDTGAYMVINDQQMASASVIKLYVMAAVLEAIETGAMEDSQEVQSLLNYMITISDNDAWTSLTELLGDGDYYLGMERVTSYARSNGYTSTEIKLDSKPYNFSSVTDTGLFLERILEGTNVSQQASEKMLSLLKAQTVVRKIPDGVPEGIVTANKTGELDNIQNDAAIVYAPTGAYVLVIFTEDASVSNIKNLSSIIYAYVNPEG